MSTTETNWLTESIKRNPAPRPLVLPLRFNDANLANLPLSDGKPSTLFRKSTGYLDAFWKVAPTGRGCLFLGRAGTYKTYASCAIARVLHIAGVDVEFVQCPVVLNRIERSRFSSGTAEVLKRIMRTPVVIMDDFSQIEPKGFGAGFLIEVAEARFSELKPTIWTGNVTIPANTRAVNILSNLYGPSFGRRVTEASEGYSVYLS